MSSESSDISEDEIKDCGNQVKKRHLRKMKVVLFALSVLIVVLILLVLLQSILLVCLMFYGSEETERTGMVEQYPSLSKVGDREHRGVITTSRELKDPVAFERETDLFMMHNEENEGKLFAMRLNVDCCLKEEEGECRTIYINAEYEYIAMNEKDCLKRGIADFKKYFPSFVIWWEKKCDEETEFMKVDLQSIKQRKHNIYECRGNCVPNTFENFLDLLGGEENVLDEVAYIEYAHWEVMRGEERGWPEPVRNDDRVLWELRHKFDKESDEWCENRLWENLEDYETMEDARVAFLEIHSLYCSLAGEVVPVPGRQALFLDVCTTVEESVVCNVRCPKFGRLLTYTEVYS